MKFLWLLTIVCPILCSGQSSKHTSQDIEQYIAAPKNHLSITRIINGVEVTLSFKPVDLLLSQDLQRYKKYTSHTVDSLRALYAGNIYFSLTLSKNGQEVENEYVRDSNGYNNIIKYLNSGIGSQLFIKINNSTTPLVGHAFVRMYNTTGKTHLMLVARRDELMSSPAFDIIINDTQLGIGTCSFSFVTEHLKNTPTIEF